MSARAIFFDLDETLVDDDRCWRIAVAATCNEIAGRHPGIDATSLSEAYLTSTEHLWRQFGSAPRTPGGLISTQDLRIAVWSSVLEAFDPDTLRLTDEILEVYAQQRRINYACFGEVAALLDRLAPAYRLGVITNGPTEGQREKLSVTGLARYFSVVLTSNEVGVGKPDAAIFRHALDAVAVAPDEALHVGDSLEADVAGALNAGLTAVWLNRNGAKRKPPRSRAAPRDHVAFRAARPAAVRLRAILLDAEGSQMLRHCSAVKAALTPRLVCAENLLRLVEVAIRTRQTALSQSHRRPRHGGRSAEDTSSRRCLISQAPTGSGAVYHL